MKFNAIGGLPRAGTTLLCNVLNQNPRFFASSTSCIPATVASTAAFMSAQDEMKSELACSAVETESRFLMSIRGLVSGWYAAIPEAVVFDKSRAWNQSAAVLEQLYPEAKLILVVRDLRDIFASVEKQHRKNPVLSAIGNIGERSVINRAHLMFAKAGGLIGAPICGIEDILRCSPKNVLLVKYETFVTDPKQLFKHLYAGLGEEYYEHNFNDVKSTATELDSLWLNKFPHDGSGKIQASEDHWSNWIPEDIANWIMQEFEAYNGAFGYV